jgi:hypothetical protein
MQMEIDAGEATYTAYDYCSILAYNRICIGRCVLALAVAVNNSK